MAFGGFERGQSAGQPMAEINVTPLVDVMLVLLVIFIITAPLLARALKLDLPQVDAPPAAVQPNTIRIGIEADGTLRVDGEAIGAEALVARLEAAAKVSPPPEVHLAADKAARYEFVAAVLGAAQKAGLKQIGFVTDAPPPAAGATQ